MFYRLKPGYILRGWEKAAWALVHRPQNEVRHLPEEVFRMLLLCDGETDISIAELDKLSSEILHKCEEQGLIESCEKPQPLEADQYYQYFKNRYVRSLFWSVTGKCNYRCRHCYMDAPDGALGEISTEEALNLIDQIASCGILCVDLTGGEALIRRDFWQLVDRLHSYHITIGKFYTNGWLLNETVLNGFERRGLKPEVSISFDGVGWHDWMRGVPGAEKAALRALRLCQERGFTTDVEMCIHRGNQSTLPETVKTMQALGVGNIKTGNVSMTDLWRCHSDGNALTDEEYIEAMIDYIPLYYEANCPMEIMLGNVIALHTDGSYQITAERYNGSGKCLNCYLCGSARWACYITPDGRLLPCMPMTSSSRKEQEKFPLVREIGLQKGLTDSFYMQFIDRRIKDLLEVNEECATCEYRFRCGGGCRAGALLKGNHDLMGCDRTQCTLWKGGYVERIRQTAEKARAAYERRKAEANA